MTPEPPTERSVMAVIRAARPTLRNANDKVAFAVHATLFASGLVLRATGPAAFSKHHSDPDPPGWYKEVGIDSWNQVQANYAFVYTKPNVNPESNYLMSLEKIVVKCQALNGKLHVDALSKGVNPIFNTDVIAQMDINVRDYVPEEEVYGRSTNYNNNSNQQYNYDSMFEDLGDLVRYVHNEIVTKFSTPPLQLRPQPVMIPGPGSASGMPFGLLTPDAVQQFGKLGSGSANGKEAKKTHTRRSSPGPGQQFGTPPPYSGQQFGKFGSGSVKGKEVEKTPTTTEGYTTTERSVMAVIRAARPAFRNDHNKAAFAVHATLFASGFVLHAAGPAAFRDEVMSYTNGYNEVGIETWNERDSHYAFLYSKPDDEFRYHRVTVECFAFNDKLHVIAQNLGDLVVVGHMEINVQDYVTEINNGANSNKHNYGSMFKNFGKLVRDVKDKIVGKFVTCPPPLGLPTPPALRHLFPKSGKSNSSGYQHSTGFPPPPPPPSMADYHFPSYFPPILI
ncbi:OLC1v1019785C1 [Oldenlandia corymbosa var. corymbosa]|uniref:OLC1v1019785C1 n=1 Tax=Oldenlandia corymbosa var. corymbosa TaxID=529605 RepID=A0AAV1EEX4_OLDCO|nr:OLC1v1019785C1 [Oldenlandia corymbosa var. corymbosa]